MSTLQELNAELDRLVCARNDKVGAALAAVKAANREFDRAAIPLSRKIHALEAEQEASATVPTRSDKPVRQPRKPAVPLVTMDDDGFTAEEVAHFQKLAATKRGKK